MITNWQNLIVTDSENMEVGSLGDFVSNMDEIDRKHMTIVGGKIEAFSQYFLSAPGEEPSWDTPKAPVDWTGFEEAVNAAQLA